VSVVVTSHAIHRWRERVDAGARWEAAEAAIARMAREGTRSEKARRWLRLGGQKLGAGCAFVYWHRRPGVVLVVCGDQVMTVMTRETGRVRRNQERVKKREDRRSERRRPRG
jgi:hypothetical protein